MLKTALFVFATSYVAWYIERHEIAAIYPFDKTYASPDAAGEPRMSEETFLTDDGERLVLWRAKAKVGQPTVLYFTGNAGGLKERSERFRRLIDRGFGVVAPAYRGSSGSTGTPNEMTLLGDARAVARAEMSPNLIIYGESLGAAVAIRLGAEGIGSKIVLEAPFTSIRALLLAQYPAEQLDHLITQKWENHLHIPALTQPLLIVHGDRDRLVPMAMGEQLFAAAGSTDKTFLRIDGKGHSGLWTVGMQSRLFAFLNRD
ncbi:MAG: alpha/beta hydrolase [Silicimonas sp.]|nr:alpha/beta hydrolase [Silicimonas sp.]